MELFLRSVRGEGSAALMTLVMEVRDDVLRSLCFLFSTVLSLNSSISSILPGEYFGLLGEETTESRRLKVSRFIQRKQRIDDNNRTPRRKFEYGGLLEMDQSRVLTVLIPWIGRSQMTERCGECYFVKCLTSSNVLENRKSHNCIGRFSYGAIMVSYGDHIVSEN